MGLSAVPKCLDESVDLVDYCLRLKVSASRNTIYHALQDCIKRKDLTGGRNAYRCMINVGLDSITVLLDHLIRLFAVCGSLLEASAVFGKTSRPSLYTWNAIIAAHANSDGYAQALTLYHQMWRKRIRPDRYTFLSVLKACNWHKKLEEITIIHRDISHQDLQMDVMVTTTLIDTYCRCGGVNEARNLFDNFLNRNIVTWGAMIAGYVEHGLYALAVELFHKMLVEGIEPNRVIVLCILKAISGVNALQRGMATHDTIIRKAILPDVEIQNSLIDMYMKCGRVNEGYRVFVQQPAQNVVSWSSLIAGYIRHGHFKAAIECFEIMRQKGVTPDHVIFTNLLTACCHVGLLEQGEWYFVCMVNDYDIMPNMEHISCMVDLFGRVGKLNEAVNFLYSMPIEMDSVLLTSILNSCRTYNNVEVAIFIFDQLFELDPTDGSIYSLMADVFCDANMWEAADHVQHLAAKHVRSLIRDVSIRPALNQKILNID